MDKYGWIIITSDLMVGLVKQEDYHLELNDLKEAVGGYIDIVHAFRQPYRFVVNDNAIAESLPWNPYASALYGSDIYGDVCLVSAIPPLGGYEEPDIYALPLRVAEEMHTAICSSMKRFRERINASGIDPLGGSETGGPEPHE